MYVFHTFQDSFHFFFSVRLQNVEQIVFRAFIDFQSGFSHVNRDLVLGFEDSPDVILVVVGDEERTTGRIALSQAFNRYGFGIGGAGQGFSQVDK